MLHAITCYFNPVGYDRLRNNLHRFVESLRGCPLTVIELSYDDSFELSDSIKIRGDEKKHNLWQKERLLNIAAESLPAEFDKIAWIDADIHFCNTDWAEHADKALDIYSVVHLFGTAHFLDQKHRIVRSQPSIVGDHKPGDAAFPGLAWAARREVFPLLDMHILGGGDNLMWHAFRGAHHLPAERGAWWRDRMSPRWLRAYLIEGEMLRRRSRQSVGRLHGDVFHYWHGSFRNRAYVDRWDMLKAHDFDPEIDIGVDPGTGLLQWTSDKPELHAAVARYFHDRREDG